MGSQQNVPRHRFFLYPEPIEATHTPRRPRDKAKPVIKGWMLVAAVFILEWVGFIRRFIWADAGFSIVRRIRKEIEDTEPRFDPTVFPLENTSDSVTDAADADAPSPDETVTKTPLAPGKRYSAADYRALYLSGELTPLDVARAILPLIRRDTEPPGEHSIAWFEVKEDLVLEAAEASTQRYREKRSLGPLDGVPTGVKDEYDVEGYTTTLGSVNDYTGRNPNEEGKIDAWCVRKLAGSGAVIMGKLSMHEFGMDTSGSNIFYGTPRNPYNNNYYPGGSSSGSAYAVSVGLVPIALGSDGGGSIRIPSSFCSVYGIKPTHGRLSCLPGQNHSNTNGVNGPIAADIESLASVYGVLSQDPHPTTHFSPSSLGSGLFRPNPSRPKVIGIPVAWFAQASDGVQDLCRAMIAGLVKERGYEVVSIEMPYVDEGQMAHALTILTDAAALLPETRGLSPGNRILLALGRTTPATDFMLAQKLRRVLMQHLAWLWERYPGMVIVTPTSACAGWPIRSPDELIHGISDGDTTIKTMKYVWLANFCGAPSITVPAGYVAPEGSASEGEVVEARELDTPGKVPVGLMATGEWASEHSLLQFGLDAEAIGSDKLSRPPTWVDVIKLATDAKDRDA